MGDRKDILEDINSVRLHVLRPAFGSHRRKKILGRGYGSGSGLYCSRGVKGQRARSGSTRMVGFEGGQTSILRRIPKRGFSSPFKIYFNIINLFVLEKYFNNGDVVSWETLVEKGVFKSKEKRLLKILSHGVLTKSLKVSIHSISAEAKRRILDLSGTVEIIR